MSMTVWVAVHFENIDDPTSGEADKAVECVTLDLKGALADYDWYVDDVVCDDPAKEKVFVAHYEPRSGADEVRVFRSAKAMHTWRDQLARDNWARLFDAAPCPDEPGEPYFERAADLGYAYFATNLVEVEA